MAIDIEKILNISINEYCSNNMTGTRSYNLVGVHSHEGNIQDFAKIIPNEAEAVVDYQHNFFGAGTDGYYDFQHHQMGVALIPRKN